MEQFDRAAEDLGNSVALEHLNTTAPDQLLVTKFYVVALGLTRDPYMNTGLGNIWINIGRSQIHLPRRKPQVMRGHTGIVMPDRDALLRRLHAAKEGLAGTLYAWTEADDYVEVLSPWGNRIRIHQPDRQRFGPVMLGMPYLHFDVPVGAAAGIGRFYAECIKAAVTLSSKEGLACANVKVGVNQFLHFQETDRPLPDYDGHHIQIYIVDFSGPHQWLLSRGLVTQESNQYQYRFQDIVDPESGKVVYTLEHEVRSITNPLYARPLVNRNPLQNLQNYHAGHDAMVWEMPQDY